MTEDHGKDEQQHKDIAVAVQLQPHAAAGFRIGLVLLRGTGRPVLRSRDTRSLLAR
jgi:hypothetical protein